MVARMEVCSMTLTQALMVLVAHMEILMEVLTYLDTALLMVILLRARMVAQALLMVVVPAHLDLNMDPMVTQTTVPMVTFMLPQWLVPMAAHTGAPLSRLQAATYAANATATLELTTGIMEDAEKMANVAESPDAKTSKFTMALITTARDTGWAVIMDMVQGLDCLGLV